MALAVSQQFFEAIKHTSSPLVLIPTHAQIDGYATALGIASVLQKLKKEPTIVAVDGEAPTTLSFLPNHKEIQINLLQLRKLIITLPTLKTKIAQITHEAQEEFSSISILPTEGFWKDHEVQVCHSAFRFDLIICDSLAIKRDLFIFGRFLKRYAY